MRAGVKERNEDDMAQTSGTFSQLSANVKYGGGTKKGGKKGK